MTITDIDKQFESIKRYIKDISVGQYDGEVNIGFKKAEDVVRDLLHQIYTQAKAEQKEADARITEGMNVGEEAGFVLSLPKFVKRDNEMFNGGYNRAVADIAKAIRSQS